MEVPEKKITRSDLPAVVKRAAELAARDADLEEEISEDEVVRIAAELGLPARHVKAALYEGAVEEPEPTFLDRQFGNRRVIVSRSVSLEVERARRVLEDYFTNSEFMVVVRRQPDAIVFQPSSDLVTTLTRAFKRGDKHQLAAAQLLELRVRELEPGATHVSLRAVFKDERKGHFAGAIMGGTFLGGVIGVVGGLLAAAATNDVGMAVSVGSVVGLGSGGGIFAGILASMKNGYREWRERTTMQTEGVLDRLEKGQDMKPPPPSWLKKLQNLGFGG